MQQHSLLQTKLYIPLIRRELVSRPRLIERLNAGLNGCLTLISAPAGPFALALRIYWPEQEILDGKWEPSAIKKA